MYKIARVAGIVAAAWSFALTAGPASATPISIGQWYEFGFGDPVGPLVGCTALTCTPGVLSTFAPDPAWTFDCPTDHCKIVVTDGFLAVDQFQLFDFGFSIGITSAPTGASGHSCSNDELACLADPLMSHGTFIVASGAHSITGTHILGIPGAAFLIVTVPEPAPLLLIGAGLLILIGMRRRA